MDRNASMLSSIAFFASMFGPDVFCLKSPSSVFARRRRASAPIRWKYSIACSVK